mmetsp:Transcript_56399/g.76908  ORF Transcript_56399/g.76908 Transcript_56399/m.76908 type:complete len:232 (-) Transcript_56399:113-808(-)
MITKLGGIQRLEEGVRWVGLNANAKILKKDWGPVDEFLGHEPSNRKHSETSVLELLCVQRGKLFSIVRLQPKWVEADVSRIVICIQSLVSGSFVGRYPSNESTSQLSDTNRKGEDLKKLRENFAHFTERVNRKNLLSFKAKKWVVELANQEANRSKHCDTTMLKFCFAIRLHLVKGAAFGESSRIKISNWIQRSRKAPRKLVFVGNPSVKLSLLDRGTDHSARSRDEGGAY